MTVPSVFVGAWQRQSIAFAGGEPAEPATVIWLQAHSAFADLRVANGDDAPLACFAGHTAWEPPQLRWSHEIDLVPSTHDDVGAVDWDGDDLVETGTTVTGGAVVSYVEVWRRLPDSNGPVVEESEPTRRRVVVGPHELVVDDRRADGGAFTACYRRDGEVVLKIESAS